MLCSEASLNFSQYTSQARGAVRRYRDTITNVAAQRKIRVDHAVELRGKIGLFCRDRRLQGTAFNSRLTLSSIKPQKTSDISLSESFSRQRRCTFPLTNRNGEFQISTFFKFALKVRLGDRANHEGGRTRPKGYQVTQEPPKVTEICELITTPRNYTFVISSSVVSRP